MLRPFRSRTGARFACVFGIVAVTVAALSTVLPIAVGGPAVGNVEAQSEDRAKIVAALRSGETTPLRDLTTRVAEREKEKAIPFLIGVIDADNSYDTVYWTGHFTLRPLTDVEYSALHDGAWWRRWWDANKARFPDAATTPVPDLPKTAHGRDYVPFPDDIDTLDGKLRVATEMFAEWARTGRDRSGWVSVGEVARRIAEHGDARAIPFLIGMIDADNSYDTVYYVGHFALGPLTGVEYSAYHDGAWWRRWWEANKARFPQEARNASTPKFPKSKHGARHVPFPAELDTLQGKLQLAREVFGRKPGAGARINGWDVAQEIAKHGDPHAIPYLIALIDADVYAVGHYGLARLTGVAYDKSHGGAWWRAWWEANKANYPEDVRSIAIPDAAVPFTFAWHEPTAEEKARAEAAEREAAMADVADVPAEDLTVEGNEKMRYFLIGAGKDATAPEAGFKLVVVLPGGDGGADFHPFVRRLYKHAMTKEFVVAQPVAPRWSLGQKIVWPTDLDREPKQEFSTEAFVEAVIADVARRRPIDRRHVYTLSWSSGGPAAYAAALREPTPVTGSYVAMSVFRPETLPPVARAKGRAFLIDHSPQDRVCKFADAERTVRDLSAAGAAVRLVTYEGGHGWRGDVYRRVADGLRWLDGQSEGRPR